MMDATKVASRLQALDLEDSSYYNSRLHHHNNTSTGVPSRLHNPQPFAYHSYDTLPGTPSYTSADANSDVARWSAVAGITADAGDVTTKKFGATGPVGPASQNQYAGISPSDRYHRPALVNGSVAQGFVDTASSSATKRDIDVAGLTDIAWTHSNDRIERGHHSQPRPICMLRSPRRNSADFSAATPTNAAGGSSICSSSAMYGTSNQGIKLLEYVLASTPSASASGYLSGQNAPPEPDRAFTDAVATNSKANNSFEAADDDRAAENGNPPKSRVDSKTCTASSGAGASSAHAGKADSQCRSEAEGDGHLVFDPTGTDFDDATVFVNNDDAEAAKPAISSNNNNNINNSNDNADKGKHPSGQPRRMSGTYGRWQRQYSRGSSVFFDDPFGRNKSGGASRYAHPSGGGGGGGAYFVPSTPTRLGGPALMLNGIRNFTFNNLPLSPPLNPAYFAQHQQSLMYGVTPPQNMPIFFPPNYHQRSLSIAGEAAAVAAAASVAAAHHHHQQQQQLSSTPTSMNSYLQQQYSPGYVPLIHPASIEHQQQQSPINNNSAFNVNNPILFVHNAAQNNNNNLSPLITNCGNFAYDAMSGATNFVVGSPLAAAQQYHAAALAAAAGSTAMQQQQPVSFAFAPTHPALASAVNFAPGSNAVFEQHLQTVGGAQYPQTTMPNVVAVQQQFASGLNASDVYGAMSAAAQLNSNAHQQMLMNNNFVSAAAGQSAAMHAAVNHLQPYAVLPTSGLPPTANMSGYPQYNIVPTQQQKFQQTQNSTNNNNSMQQHNGLLPPNIIAHHHQQRTPPNLPVSATSAAASAAAAAASQQKPRSRLLEDFRNNQVPDMPFSAVRGHVIEFARDQHGSRFIQQHLDEACSVEDLTMVFDEVAPALHDLSTDVFANYVVQKYFETCTHEQRIQLGQCVMADVLRMSMHMYGCRVVQKALEVLQSPMKEQLAHAFAPHVIELIRDQNGNHVVQKALETVAPHNLQFIVGSCHNHLLELSIHMYGCRVVQRIMENMNSEQLRVILNELVDHTEELVRNEFGNYVIQHILEHGQTDMKNRVIAQLKGHLYDYCHDKYASNVMEKCISNATRAQRQQLLEEIIQGDRASGGTALLALLRDQFGNYVVQKMIDLAEPQQRKQLLYQIKPHVLVLRKYHYGKHIIAKLEKFLGTRQVAAAVAAAGAQENAPNAGGNVPLPPPPPPPQMPGPDGLDPAIKHIQQRNNNNNSNYSPAPSADAAHNNNNSSALVFNNNRRTQQQQNFTPAAAAGAVERRQPQQAGGMLVTTSVYSGDKLQSRHAVQMAQPGPHVLGGRESENNAANNNNSNAMPTYSQYISGQQQQSHVMPANNNNINNKNVFVSNNMTYAAQRQ